MKGIGGPVVSVTLLRKIMKLSKRGALRICGREGHRNW